MTEQEWLASADPVRMLAQLRGSGAAAAGHERKLRLFACACCRRVWRLLEDERSRRAVEVTERFVDGKATRKEWRLAAGEARACTEELEEGPSPASTARYRAACAAFTATYNKNAARDCAPSAASVYFPSFSDVLAERACQADLLRDVVGSPFRPASPLDPACLTEEVRALAQAAYEARALPEGHLDPQRLAVLADALEEAGCASADLLAHLRSPGGTHVRGCWAVDLALGRG